MTYRTEWNTVEEASYSEPLQPHLRGNPLIEALPPMRSDEEVYRALRSKPPFALEQRTWDTYARIPMLHTLSDFMVPMSRHLAIARFMENSLRQGYLGRGPNTKRHVDVLSKIHFMRQGGIELDQSRPTNASLTAAFVGLSGTAKTTTLRLVSRLFPKVIYHPALRIWQVPILRVSFPADGHSLKGPLMSVYTTLHSYLVDAGYDLSAAKLHRRGMHDLAPDMASVLHRHFVGMVVFDEVQNARHAPKDKKYLTALLVELSNELGVPILFVGTNQVSEILSGTMASGRRSIGLGLRYWDRYLWHPPGPEGALAEDDEWTPFFKVLWRQQWVRKPRPFDMQTSQLVHELTQGIPDVAIKLFAAAQYRAMHNRSEEVTDTLLASVADCELKPIEPMLRALRTGDKKLLAKYDDLAPLRARAGNLDPTFDQTLVPSVVGAKIAPNDPSFGGTLTDAMRALGVPQPAAEKLAERVESEHPRTNVIRGMQHALRMLQPGPSRRAAKDSIEPSVPVSPLLDSADLRNARVPGGASSNEVVGRLREMGIVFDMTETLEAS